MLTKRKKYETCMWRILLKGGALSEDRPIDEKVPPVLKSHIFIIQYDFKGSALCKRP